MKKIFAILLLLTITVTLSACKPPQTEDTNLVYTTVYPVEYLVKRIAGNFVDVERVPGSAAGGHSDELHWTGKEIISMINADLLIYVDAGVDTYISNSIDSVFNDGDVKLINLSEEIVYDQVCYSHEHDHSDEHEGEEHADEEEHHEEEVCEVNMLSDDPHFWLSPQKMLDAAAVIIEQLKSEFPDHASIFDDNYGHLVEDLTDLDDGFKLIASEATKPIITSNMLFNYWHTTYDIEVISLSADAHNSEVVPGEVIEFVDEAVFHNINCIFIEAYTNSPTADLVLEQLLLQDDTAHLGVLYNLVNLGPEDVQNEDNYLTLMQKNLDELRKATK